MAWAATVYAVGKSVFAGYESRSTADNVVRLAAVGAANVLITYAIVKA